MYHYLDAALFRSSSWPAGTELPARPVASGDPQADSTAWRTWITAVWSHPEVRDPVTVASGQLGVRLDAISRAEPVSARQVRRAAFALHRYLLRMRHRATPFGFFAGVAPVTLGERVRIDWALPNLPRARADAGWVESVASQLESCPDLLLRLQVTVEATLTAREGRLVVPCAPGRGPDQGPAELSIRSTALVRSAVAGASAPIRVSNLIDRMADEHPAADVDRIAHLLAGLVAAGVLHTNLRPAMTVTDPARHLIRELEHIDVGVCTQAHAILAGLRELDKLMLRHDRAPAPRKALLRTTALHVMTQIAPAGVQPLDVDLRLGATVTLPPGVVRESERAADVLAQVTARPYGSRSWADYHRRFIDEYGPGAVVPLLRLVDPNLGLGWPAGYRPSLLPHPVATVTDRDRLLLHIAQRAAHDRLPEVELTEAQIRRLDQRQLGKRHRELPHLDMRVQVRAASRQALESGDFTLVVDGVVPSAGAAAGRFLDLLNEAERQCFTTAVRSAPTLVDGAVRMQLSSPPLTTSTWNVARVPAVLPVLAVGEPGPVGALTVDGLGVGADAHQFYVVELASGRIIEPVLMNAVELMHRTHPLTRLLAELPRARAAAFGPFDWGTAEALPYLPRVRAGRTILARASWRLDAQDLDGETGWQEALQAWRSRYQIPAVVEVGDSDQRLRLDLDVPGDAELLRAALGRTNSVAVGEGADPKDFGWCDGRPHGITIALASDQPSQRRPALGHVPVRADADQLPGTAGWASLKLYGHPDQAEALLVRHLPRLLAEQLRWWFIRYRDPHPHLRLRLPVPSPDAFGPLAAQVAEWVGELRDLGLASRAVWTSYLPETGRYGEGPALQAAESVFVADSFATVAQLAFQHATGIPGAAITAASLIDLSTALLGDTRSAGDWLIRHVSTADAPHPERPLLQHTIALAHPDPAYPTLTALPGGTDLAAAWTARSRALAAYRTALNCEDSPRPLAVLPSLLHMHHIRAVGPDETSESLCLRLARSAALSRTAREGARP